MYVFHDLEEVDESDDDEETNENFGFEFLKINKAGTVNKEIQIKLKE